MEYLEFKIKCKEEYKEILIAELAEIGFDAFLETDSGLEVYITEELFQEDSFRGVITKYEPIAGISVLEGKVPKVNWNEEWEKNYQPIEVGKDVYVRASFHPPAKEFRHEIIINPKMSFGTGHHSTTYLMLTLQCDLDHRNKRVLDIGSGTGILAIMAHKLGASKVEAFDIDEWCVENGNENFLINQIEDVRMGLGTVRQMRFQENYDIILANINKNILLDEMVEYQKILKPKGHLLLSGFYEQDVPDLVLMAESMGLSLDRQKTRNAWAALDFLNKGDQL